MTWEDLKRIIKWDSLQTADGNDPEMIEIHTRDIIYYLWANGTMTAKGCGDILGTGNYGRVKINFAKNRTPDQMYAIITALTETKESK